MKKSFLLSVLVICFASFSFGNLVMRQKDAPVTQEDIWAYRIIQRNASVNNLANPNDIWPGQWLYYYLPDGSDTTARIVKDDNQTKVVKRIIKEKNLAELWSKKIPSVPTLIEEDKDLAQKGISEVLHRFPLLGWLIITVGLLIVIIAIIILINNIITFLINEKKAKQKKEESKFSPDPTKEGKPFVEGGVKNESEADHHFVNMARRSNPGLNPSKIVIKDKEKVYISTPNGESAVVEFADGTKDDLCFRNVIGWIAMVSIDGGKTFKREAFFQDCGNPVYSRTSMIEDGLILTKEPIVFGDEQNQTQEVFEKDSVSPEQITEAKKSLEEKAKTAEAEKQKEVSIDSELLKVASEHTTLSGSFLQLTNAHKVTLEVTLPNGSVIKTVLETKIEKSDKKTENKTEETK